MEVAPVSIFDQLKGAFESQSQTAPDSSAPAAVPQPAEQAPATEQPVAEPKPAADDELLAPRFAKLRQEAQKTAAERKAFAEERAQHGERLKKLEQWERVIEGAESDPMALVTLAKKAPDEFVKLLTTRGTVSPELKEILQTKEELKSLKAEREKEKQEAAQARETQERAYYRQAVEDKLKSDDRFELTRANTGPDLVLDVMRQHYDSQVAAGAESPQGMTWEQAAQHVENYLFEQMKPFLSTKRVRDFFASQSAPSAQSATREPGPTLNSNMGATSAPRPSTSAAVAPSNSAEDPLDGIAAELKKMFGGR